LAPQTIDAVGTAPRFRRVAARDYVKQDLSDPAGDAVSVGRMYLTQREASTATTEISPVNSRHKTSTLRRNQRIRTHRLIIRIPLVTFFVDLEARLLVVRPGMTYGPVGRMIRGCCHRLLVALVDRPIPRRAGARSLKQLARQKGATVFSIFAPDGMAWQ
jgi:hypothetical protein